MQFTAAQSPRACRRKGNTKIIVGHICGQGNYPSVNTHIELERSPG